MISRLFAVFATGLLWAGLAFAQVNINSASKEQLDGLKGIVPTKAQAIIDYRRQHGPFNSVDELENVPGIGPATLKDIRGSVMVSGPSRPPAAAQPAMPAKNRQPRPRHRPRRRQQSRRNPRNQPARQLTSTA